MVVRLCLFLVSDTNVFNVQISTYVKNANKISIISIICLKWKKFKIIVKSQINSVAFTSLVKNYSSKWNIGGILHPNHTMDMDTVTINMDVVMEIGNMDGVVHKRNNSVFTRNSINLQPYLDKDKISNNLLKIIQN